MHDRSARGMELAENYVRGEISPAGRTGTLAAFSGLQGIPPGRGLTGPGPGTIEDEGSMRRLRPAGGSPRLAGRKVLVVLASFELGGAERQALILARHLAHREGADVGVWGLGAAGPVEGLCREAALPSRVIPVAAAGGRFATFLAVARAARELRRAGADVLIPYTLVPNVVCGCAARKGGSPAAIWNQRDTGLQFLGRRLERWAIRRTRGVVANARAGAEFLHERLGVDPRRVRIVPNGVETATGGDDARTVRSRLGLGEKDFVVCMVANLHANKDHETLLRAWRILTDRWAVPGRGCVLVLAGRHGEMHARLVELAGELGIEGCVRFPGPIEDVPALLRAADLAVMSSRAEGCPNAVLEAMAAGLAIVGTDTAGIRGAVGPDGDPLLARAGDAGALAEKLRLAASDDALRTGLGAAMRRRATEEFGSDAMSATMTRIVLEVLP